jgi:hypothetical protein
MRSITALAQLLSQLQKQAGQTSESKLVGSRINTSDPPAVTNVTQTAATSNAVKARIYSIQQQTTIIATGRQVTRQKFCIFITSLTLLFARLKAGPAQAKTLCFWPAANCLWSVIRITNKYATT